MKVAFNGVHLIYHDSKKVNSRLTISMSYRTALFFLDGKNILSCYPSKTDSVDHWAREIKDIAKDYAIKEITDEDCRAMADYIIAAVRE